MKAFVVSSYGPGGLVPADVPSPAVGPEDVLIDVRAAGVNPLDARIRDGDFKQILRYKPPFALGHDVAGVVSAVGAAVRDFKVGDEVYARPRDHRIGTFAEAIAVDQADVALKPSTLSFVEAAAVPLVALTAWQALVKTAELRPGQRVLVHGGSGGLGSTVIQLAKHLGAYVIATAGTANVERVKTLGADEVVDYKTQDFAALVGDFDVVLDSVGGDNLTRSMAVLRPGGIAISVVGPPDPSFADQLGQPLLTPVLGLMSLRTRLRAKRRGVRYSFLFMRADGAQLAQLAELYDAGHLRPVVDRTFGFDDTVAAVTLVGEGRANGKVVIERTPA